MTPVIPEPLLGYHPCSIGFLTSRRDPAVGQCQTGSLTGAGASERVSEALKGSLRMVGNHPKSAKAEGSLTVTPVSYTHLGLIAYCGIWRSFEDGDITNVAVDERYRKKGFARLLLRALMQKSAASGVENFTLEAVSYTHLDVYKRQVLLY